MRRETKEAEDGHALICSGSSLTGFVLLRYSPGFILPSEGECNGEERMLRMDERYGGKELLPNASRRRPLARASKASLADVSPGRLQFRTFD
jgi:hypothetical protein